MVKRLVIQAAHRVQVAGEERSEHIRRKAFLGLAVPRDQRGHQSRAVEDLPAQRRTTVEGGPYRRVLCFVKIRLNVHKE